MTPRKAPGVRAIEKLGSLRTSRSTLREPPEASDQPYNSPNELPRAILLLILQAVVSVGVMTLIFFTGFAVAGCGDRCDYDLLGAAHHGATWLIGGAFATSLAVVVWRARRRRVSWWAPAVATVIVILGGAAAVGLMRVAVG